MSARKVKVGLAEKSKTSVRSFMVGHSSGYYRILGIVAFLSLLGLAFVLSSSSVDAIKNGNSGFIVFLKQAMFAILGFIGMLIASRLSFAWVRRYIMIFLLGAGVLQFLTVTVLGYSVNGNRNWISVFGFFTVQPSEILKLALILYLADYLANRDNDPEISVTWTRPFWIGIGAIGLVLLGKDMGTAMIMVAILLGVLAFAGMPRPKLFKYAALVVVGGFFALQLSSSRIPRIMAWMNPGAPDPMQYNWQQTHATWAFASGGVTGAGLGQSKLKWSWIPEAENDFIFAIIGEEGGLLVSIMVVALFVALIYSLLGAAERTSDDFSRFLILGVLTWVGVQSMVNIAVVLGLLPVLGVPLPLISAGGSSLVMLLVAVGLVLGAERQFGQGVARRKR